MSKPRRTPTDRDATLLDQALALAPAQGGVITTAQAKSLGASDADLRRLVSGGDLWRIRRAVYASRAGYLAALKDREVRHHLAAAAALAAMRTDAVVSHTSAARILSLPTPPFVDDLVHLTRRPPSSANDLRGTDLHVSGYDDADVVMVHGVPVLAGPRVVIDAAAVMPPDSALAVADAAIRLGVCTHEQLVRLYAEKRGHPGTAGAALIIERADPGSESWLESTSRWWFMDAGLPRPLLQYEFRDRGVVRARVDMYVREGRTVGEADGLGKYVTRADLIAEKIREDWLRSEHGVEVVRWTTGEMRTRRGRAAVMGRWWAALERGSRR